MLLAALGSALVTTLAEQGWQVVAVARNAEDLNSITPLVLEADVSRPHDVERAILAASQEVDQIDLWVYAAGDIASVKVEEMAPVDWQRILDANLTGAFTTAHYSLPLLAPDAHLFFLGAVSERMQMPGLSAYAAAKAGLEAFAESLRKEARKRRSHRRAAGCGRHSVLGKRAVPHAGQRDDARSSRSGHLVGL